MPIPVKCSQCGFSRTVPDEFAGKQGKCPQCSAAVRVPTPAPKATSSAALSAPKPAAKPATTSSTAKALPQAARQAPAPAPAAKRPAPAQPKPQPAYSAPIEEPEVEETIVYQAPTEEPAATSEPEGDSSWADLASAAAGTTSSRSRRSSSSKRSSARKPGKAEASEDGDSGSSRRGKKAAAKPAIPMWAIAAVLAFVMLAVGGGTYYALSGGEPAKVAKTKKAKPKPKKDDQAAVLDTTKTGKMDAPKGIVDMNKPSEEKRPAADAPLEDIFAWVKPGIVVIEVFSGGQQIGMGSGFVIDSAGIIVTNYHVSSPGDAAYAKFTDDSRYEIAGYLAVKPEWDLAILQLKEKPANLRVLNLVQDKKPREASKVMAVGSPLGHTFVPTSGIVGRVVQATDLPPSARSFVRQQTGHDEQFWIEHDAKIAPGNSGGPLFNMAGDVVGVNSWVDTSVSFGYAIWSWYVHDLLSHKLPQIAPLSQYKKAAVSPAKLLAGSDLTPDMLQKVFDEGEAMKWHPADVAQYSRLQEFGKLLAVAKYADKVGLPKEVSAKATELSAKLVSMAWSPDEHINPVCKLALPELNKPGTGTMLFAKIKTKQSVQNLTLLILTVEGSSQVIAVPAVGVEAALKEGTLCLVAGIVADGKMAFATPAEGRTEAPILQVPVVVLPIKAPG